MTQPGLYPVTLVGPRVTLREVTLNDVAAVYAYASQPQVTTHTVWDLHPNPEFTRQLVQSWVEQSQAPFRPRYELAIIFENHLVGMARISVEAGAHRRGNLGYVLNPSVWGHGIGSETAAILVEFGFTKLNLHRIWGKARPANHASRRILEKAGMLFEGILRDDLFIHEKFYDMASYAVLETDPYQHLLTNS